VTSPSFPPSPTKDIHLVKASPEADLQHIVHGIVRRGLKPVFMRQGHWRRRTLFLFLKLAMIAKMRWLGIVILIILIVVGAVFSYFWFAENDPLMAPAMHMQYY